MTCAIYIHGASVTYVIRVIVCVIFTGESCEAFITFAVLVCIYVIFAGKLFATLVTFEVCVLVNVVGASHCSSALVTLVRSVSSVVNVIGTRKSDLASITL